MKTVGVSIVIAALMTVAAAVGVAARPSSKPSGAGPRYVLETIVPKEFGGWREIAQEGAQVVNPQTQELLNKLYSQILTRTYVNASGYRVMLSLAYGDDQRADLTAHKPGGLLSGTGLPAAFERRGRTRDAVRADRGATSEHQPRRAQGTGDVLVHRRRSGDPQQVRSAHRRGPPRSDRADSGRLAVPGLVDRPGAVTRLRRAGQVRRRAAESSRARDRIRLAGLGPATPAP